MNTKTNTLRVQQLPFYHHSQFTPSWLQIMLASSKNCLVQVCTRKNQKLTPLGIIFFAVCGSEMEIIIAQLKQPSVQSLSLGS
jgi:hypothetical protein